MCVFNNEIYYHFFFTIILSITEAAYNICATNGEEGPYTDMSSSHSTAGSTGGEKNSGNTSVDGNGAKTDIKRPTGSAAATKAQGKSPSAGHSSCGGDLSTQQTTSLVGDSLDATGLEARY